MNAVIFYPLEFNHRRAEIFFDAFEYYISILENGGKITLLIVDNEDIPIEEVVTRRYNLDDLDWKKNIERCTRRDLGGKRYDQVLFVDSQSASRCAKMARNFKKKIVINDFGTDVVKRHFGDTCEIYGELLQHHRDHAYRMKMLFNRMRSLDTPLKGVKTITEPPRDFYGPEFFKELVIKYNRDSKREQPHPRFFVEANFYGNKIRYVDLNNVRDGSRFRHKEGLIRDSWKKRVLTKTDEIVRRFL